MPFTTDKQRARFAFSISNEAGSLLCEVLRSVTMKVRNVKLYLPVVLLHGYEYGYGRRMCLGREPADYSVSKGVVLKEVNHSWIRRERGIPCL